MAGESELYLRQRELPLAVPESAIVVGCGGVGAWVATLLTISGVKRLYLYDPDAVEESNLNRLPLPRASVGAPKVKALRDWLISLRPEAVIAAAQAAVRHTVLVPAEVLFDCTDDWTVREPIYRFCQREKIRYIRAGYDGGEHLTVASTLPWQAGTPTGRYETTPSWVVPAVLVAALAVHQVMRLADDGTISLDIDALIALAKNGGDGKEER